MGSEAVVLQLFKATRFLKVLEIKKLINKLSDDSAMDLLLTTVSSRSEKNTIIHAAAKHGCDDLVDAILEISSLSSLVSAKNRRGNTPMHVAAAHKRARIITSLINHIQKADQEEGATRGLQDMLKGKNEQGNTPIHEAARAGHKQVMEILLKTLDPTLLDQVLNEVNEVGETPLSLAILAKSSTTVEAILKAKPNTSFKFRGLDNQTILHMTVLKHDSVTVSVILGNRPELAKEKDSNGRTPLHYAAALGDSELIWRLLEHDASVAYIADKNEMLPLHLAAANDDISIFDRLHRSSPNTIEFTDNKRQNVLHIATQKGNINVVARLLRLSEIEELINSVDKDGNTPLHLSINHGHSKIVHLLFKHPRVNLRVIDRKTILDTFSENRQSASSSSSTDQEKAWSVRLRHLIMQEDPHDREKILRDCLGNQAVSIDDILELPNCVGRSRTKYRPVDQKLKDVAGVVMLVATLVTTVTGDVIGLISSVVATLFLLVALWNDNQKSLAGALSAAFVLTAFSFLCMIFTFLSAMLTVVGDEKSKLTKILVVSLILPVYSFMAIWGQFTVKGYYN